MLPLSVIILAGIPKSLTQYTRKRRNSSRAVIVFLHSIYLDTLVQQSTITSIESEALAQPTSMLGGRSVIKSILIDSNSFKGIFSACISPQGLYCTSLIHWQQSQHCIYSLVSQSKPGQQYLRWISSWVFLYLKCLAKGLLQQILKISIRTA